MCDQEGPWPRSVTSIALRRGAGLRSPQVGRAYVVICGRGGLRSRGPYQISDQSYFDVHLITDMFSDNGVHGRLLHFAVNLFYPHYFMVLLNGLEAQASICPRLRYAPFNKWVK
uniref:Uncharacterized protein n=1 Tax=Manihot esculenta TaxID=3983 RepID=A0A2C9VLT2_MANES